MSGTDNIFILFVVLLVFGTVVAALGALVIHARRQSQKEDNDSATAAPPPMRIRDGGASDSREAVVPRSADVFDEVSDGVEKRDVFDVAISKGFAKTTRGERVPVVVGTMDLSPTVWRKIDPMRARAELTSQAYKLYTTLHPTPPQVTRDGLLRVVVRDVGPSTRRLVAADCVDTDALGMYGYQHAITLACNAIGLRGRTRLPCDQLRARYARILAAVEPSSRDIRDGVLQAIHDVDVVVLEALLPAACRFHDETAASVVLSASLPPAIREAYFDNLRDNRARHESRLVDLALRVIPRTPEDASTLPLLHRSLDIIESTSRPLRTCDLEGCTQWRDPDLLRRVLDIVERLPATDSGPHHLVRHLLYTMNYPDDIRIRAARFLGKHGTEGLDAVLTAPLLHRPSGELGEVLVSLLGDYGSERAIPSLEHARTVITLPGYVKRGGIDEAIRKIRSRGGTTARRASDRSISAGRVSIADAGSTSGQLSTNYTNRG